MENVKEQHGRRFRQAWIEGVQRYYPGTPKPGYISPWEEMPGWEQEAASAVYNKARALILSGLQHEPATRLAPEQGGRFIAEAWTVQMYRLLGNPKPGYVADWEDLPEWQRRTDIDIFAEIEAAALEDVAQV
ncbi:hypothetical protein [Ktedonobacter racemifer]|uniref:Uncharacterized protein n=1 Tax=Ktedonobacter racemifer DSM 44963 TaxID=485913 RepID=D6TCI9_KTERA|nr:hypothetical protein [Ktedonobacter racemifer]EFH90006.1 conserved hypothetical protein [Ktedonobacter racemifer DSM 44963]